MNALGKKLSEVAKQFSTGERNEFFSLKNDGDKAVVRFLYEGEDDLDWAIVHQVEIGGKKRYVKCLETDDCPLCLAGYKRQLKVFLQLVCDGKVMTWERGRKFVPVIVGQTAKYSPRYSRAFELVRSGKPNDPSTSYQLYPLDPDGVKLEDLPAKQELIAENGFVLVKSKEDMEMIVEGKYSYQGVAGIRRPVSGEKVF